MLSSPIILEDHPRIAPESPGDLFDGGEIDELLVLNILGDDRRGEGRDARRRPAHARDPGAHRGADAEELMRLHGAIRELAARDDAGARRLLGGARAPGARRRDGRRRRAARAQPRAPAPAAGGDVLDLALAGRAAVVEGIEQDMDGNVRSRSSSRTTPGATSARTPARAPLLLRARGGRAARRASPRPGRRRRASWSRASATCSSATTASASRSPGGWRGGRCRRASRSSTSASAAWTSPTRCSEGYDGGRAARRHAARRARRARCT